MGTVWNEASTCSLLSGVLSDFHWRSFATQVTHGEHPDGNSTQAYLTSSSTATTTTTTAEGEEVEEEERVGTQEKGQKGNRGFSSGSGPGLGVRGSLMLGKG